MVSRAASTSTRCGSGRAADWADPEWQMLNTGGYGPARDGSWTMPSSTTTCNWPSGACRTARIRTRPPARNGEIASTRYMRRPSSADTGRRGAARPLRGPVRSHGAESDADTALPPACATTRPAIRDEIARHPEFLKSSRSALRRGKVQPARGGRAAARSGHVAERRKPRGRARAAHRGV